MAVDPAGADPPVPDAATPPPHRTDEPYPRVPPADATTRPSDGASSAASERISVTNNYWMSGAGKIDEGERPTRASDPKAVSIAEEGVRAIQVYVEGGEHTAARHRLATRLLILTAPAGSGKRTAALALLGELVRPEDLVSLPPDLTLGGLADLTTVPGRGLLLEGANPTEVVSTSQHHIDALVARLRAADAWAVVTINGTLSSGCAAEEHSTRWKPADIRAVLDKNVAFSLPPDEAATVTAALGDVALDGCSTRQIAEAVDLLLQIAPLDDGITAARAVLDGVHQRDIDDWLESGPTPEEICRMLTLSVMSGARAADVARAESDLRLHLRIDKAEDVPGQIFDPWPRLVAKLGTCMTNEPGPTGLVERFIEFDPPLRRRLALQSLFREYTRLHEPLLEWIAELGLQPSVYIRYQAAQAAADLTELHATDVLAHIVDEWAGADSLLPREAAAFWVGHLVRSRTSESLAFARLRTWSRSTRFERRWTAAKALADGVAIRYPETTLNLLRRIIVHHEAIPRPVVRSLAEFFDDRDHREGGRMCLARLVDWTGARAEGDQRDRALTVALELIGSRWTRSGACPAGLVFEWIDGTETLVSLIESDTRPVSRLLCRGLVSPDHADATTAILERLIRAAVDEHCSMHLARTVVAQMMAFFEQFDRGDGAGILRDYLRYLADDKHLSLRTDEHLSLGDPTAPLSLQGAKP